MNNQRYCSRPLGFQPRNQMQSTPQYHQTNHFQRSPQPRSPGFSGPFPRNSSPYHGYHNRSKSFNNRSNRCPGYTNQSHSSNSSTSYFGDVSQLSPYNSPNRNCSSSFHSQNRNSRFQVKHRAEREMHAPSKRRKFRREYREDESKRLNEADSEIQSPQSVSTTPSLMDSHNDYSSSGDQTEDWEDGKKDGRSKTSQDVQTSKELLSREISILVLKSELHLASNKRKKLEEDLKSCENKMQDTIKNELFKILEDDLICNICTEFFIKPTLLACTHTFCLFCIKKWKETKNECPICRHSMETMTPVLALERIVDKAVSVLTREQTDRRNQIISKRENQLKKAVTPTHRRSYRRSQSASENDVQIITERNCLSTPIASTSRRMVYSNYRLPEM